MGSPSGWFWFMDSEAEEESERGWLWWVVLSFWKVNWDAMEMREDTEDEAWKSLDKTVLEPSGRLIHDAVDGDGRGCVVNLRVDEIADLAAYLNDITDGPGSTIIVPLQLRIEELKMDTECC